jgi:protein-S-isoprenylcysteine O-methyltransferase Ste14
MGDTRLPSATGWKLGLKTAAFVVLYVGTVAIGIPVLLVWLADGRWALGLGSARFFGIVPLIGGLITYLYCTAHLTGRGKGIPAPFDPTQRLVASGPYAMVRNPMYGAASLYFIGLAILLDAGVLLGYAAVMMTGYWVGVVLLEEPALARRFGAAFDEYCRRTPRWFPSLRRLNPAASGHAARPADSRDSGIERRP